MIRHVIIKVSGGCNLACSYCYYMTDRPQHLQVAMSAHVMTATLRGLSRYAAAHRDEVPTITLYWHGGEPLLRPFEFWTEVQEVLDETALAGFRWINRITTNAMLVDDRAAAFLARHDWTVNVSIDGPQEQHDRERVDHLGRGSYAKVIEGYRRLQRAGIEPTVFSVLRDEPGAGASMYEHHKALGVTSCDVKLPKYNWASEPDADAKSGRLLREVMAFYRAWDADGRPMKVRFFDTVFSKLRHGAHLVCHHVDGCNEMLTIEPTGDAFLCDDLLGFDYAGAKLGFNVLCARFEWIAAAIDRAIEQARYRDKSDECKRCEIFDICGGGCPVTRWDGRTYANPSAHCGVFKGLFTHIKDDWESREATVGARLARSFALAAHAASVQRTP